MEEEDTDIEILDAEFFTAALGRRNPVVAALAKKDEDKRSRNAITFMAAFIVYR